MSAFPRVDLARHQPEDYLTSWEDAGLHDVDGCTVLVSRCIEGGPAARHMVGLYFWDVIEPRHTGLEARDLFDTADEALDDARIRIERAQDRSLDR
jgi:hypothetical protein